jgi:hypothetical protein
VRERTPSARAIIVALRCCLPRWVLLRLGGGATTVPVLARDESFEVEPQKRPGVRGPHVEVPIVLIDAYVVEPGELAAQRREQLASASYLRPRGARG